MPINDCANRDISFLYVCPAARYSMPYSQRVILNPFCYLGKPEEEKKGP